MSELSYQHLLADPLTGKTLSKLLKLHPNVDCLLPNASLALDHFSAQWKQLAAKFNREIAEDEALLKHPGLHELMRSRIEKTLDENKKFFHQLNSLFSSIPLDLNLSHPFFDKALSGLGHTLPLTQPLIGHPKNIFRDWAWGESENKFYLDLVRKITSGQKKNILVVAAGAGRLAFDLHHTLKADHTFALDNSYFFAKSFQKICFEEGIELTEFPQPSLGDENYSVHHRLKAPHESSQGLVYHLADLNYLPYQEESFDLIVTPWIIDLIPQTLPFLISNIAGLLKPQGQWINFGPYSLSADIPTRCRWSQNELRGFIDEVGFESFQESWQSVEYLKSPHSSLVRQERLWTFSCTKNSRGSHKIQRLQLKEPWLINPELSVPLSSKVQASLMTHKVPMRVFELIDGKRSLKAISQMIAIEFQMTEGEAQQALQQFLSRWAESN